MQWLVQHSGLCEWRNAKVLGNLGKYVEMCVHPGTQYFEDRKLSTDFITFCIDLHPNDVQRKGIINHISTYNLIIKMFSWQNFLNRCSDYRKIKFLQTQKAGEHWKISVFDLAKKTLAEISKYLDLYPECTMLHASGLCKVPSPVPYIATKCQKTTPFCNKLVTIYLYSYWGVGGSVSL